MERFIQLRRTTKHFDLNGEVVAAVDGIDLDINQGEIVALLGPNGAGKTTTLDMILGFTEPTSGEVLVFGDHPRQAVNDGRVSAVLQTGGLLRDLRVAETVQLVASTYRRSGSQGASIEEVMERAGLNKIADRQVVSCSGGEQQRLRFGLALLADPDLLLLDEPTAGMDVQARREFWAAMEAEAERGRTVVFATHYLQEAEDYAQRTILMANGKVVADGPTEEVRTRASGRTIKARLPQNAVERAVAVIGQRPEVNTVAIDKASGDLDRIIIDTASSDDIARLLLNELGGRDLEIEPASLETAFIKLTDTAQPSQSTSPAHPVTAGESR